MTSFEQFYKTQIAPDRGEVALAYCHGDVIRPAFVRSVVRAIATDRGRLIHGYITSEGLYVPRGRNDIADQFLERSGCEWLWFLDTDVAFPEDALSRMLAASRDGERKILAAPYWSIDEEGEPYCTWMGLNDGSILPYREIPEEGVFELAACGMGCTLIHRDVLVDVAKSRKDEDPWVWFGHDLLETGEHLTRLGEDVSFCLRAARAGHATWGVCGVEVDHLKVQATRRGPSFKTHLDHRATRVNGIPVVTAVTEREVARLRELAKGKRVLEIGGGHGYSTGAMAEVAEHVTSVDPHEDEMPNSWDTINEHLRERGVEDRVTLVRKPSSEALPALHESGERFDLVFVDGNHSEDAVRHDFSWGLDLLRPGGHLACHDYGNFDCPGVYSALKEVPKIDVVDTLWIHRVSTERETA